jgi:hypothetical protein
MQISKYKLPNAYLAIFSFISLFCFLTYYFTPQIYRQYIRLRAPTMPSFSTALENMRPFYRIEFFPDGYPGRDDGWAHPIYGVYVIDDYIAQYKKSPGPALRAAISMVAHAAVHRMDNYRGALVFWYNADPERGGRIYDRHFSALTQSYYARALAEAGTVLADESLVSAANLVYKSLHIATEDGGVLHNTAVGPVLAEVPQIPNSWILNGWLSALVSISEYARITGLPEPTAFVLESSNALLKVLELYDDPEHENSRYGLTGFAYTRLNFTEPGTELVSISLKIDDEKPIKFAPISGTRWQNTILPTSKVESSNGNLVVIEKQLNLNGVFSLFGKSDNRIDVVFSSSTRSLKAAAVQIGDYDPLSSSPVNERWVELPVVYDHTGLNASIDIPRSIVEHMVYPTNFVKKINGKQTNVYHGIHTQQLKRLAKITGIKEFGVWAEKWTGYACNWSNIPLYKALYVKNIEADPKNCKMNLN